ncbi:MAG TPA: hypothetical protein VFQ90_16805 [Stellaceae bacterium]|jgi:hypothetical protein|nr:hypothetical protein [Stellaceae bacterium]
MANHKNSLRNLAAGDIFHARSRNGASLVCLVTAVDERAIYARRIHTQDDVQFDRTTGVEQGKPHTKIDCIAPFPADIHQIFVDMDRRHQAAMEQIRNGVPWEVAAKAARLTPEERRAHRVLDEHIAANPV